MYPHPRNFPFVSYVISRLPSIGDRTRTPTAGSGSEFQEIDLEQPRDSPSRPPSDPSSSSPSSPSGLNHPEIVGRMPRLTDPKLLDAMTRAISDVTQTRSVLKLIGDRPDHEIVDNAKAQLADLEAQLSRQLEEIVLTPRPDDIDDEQWRAHLSTKEKEIRNLVEKDKRIYKSVIQLDEMHESYEKLLHDAEKRLVKIYESAKGAVENEEDDKLVEEEVNEEVVGILQEANGKGMERVYLSGRNLRLLPEVFGRIPGLVVLDVSSNRLKVIPDSVAALENLEELNLSSNVLEALPDSIGLLHKLRFLNVSGNKLSALPDSICQCRSLVELDASFNSLSYLPTNIGNELVHLEKLSIQLNKLRSLPSSVCEMKSLRYLDAHFNELHGLPTAIGKLINLQVLNLSSNFSDLHELPETLSDLTNLKELDLSNNQIHALPDTFGRLDNLTKLNLEQNPLELPPIEIVKKGAEAVKSYMAKRRIDILAEEDRNNTHEMQGQAENGWITRSTSWLKNSVTVSPRDPYLEQQL
ncbi:hypothetical protein L6164_011024 [Bauhinia variegata]|uniref:Uncharacterized protein n=1 Tax=Bauhinia variegata TaxID=167791 RepID=A0ACB9P4D8_BAUVA|nr:hypothetical protein L6164_011024 [Bauhinia variegata]